MKLHQNTELFKNAVRITAQSINLPDIYIEKDYWVTLVLKLIFTSTLADDIIFKGGTALSKCYGYIKRFSEDIDLVVLSTPEVSPSSVKEKLKKVTQLVGCILPEIPTEGVTNKKGVIRKTAHSYTKQFVGDFGQVRDLIILEITSLGNYEPYALKPVNSLIFEMMRRTNQLALAEEYGLLPFTVKALEPKRTICEKIMSLVRFSNMPNPIDDLKKKIRHTYDLHQLLLDNELLSFFYSDDFDKMLLQVANEDVVSFKNNNSWLIHHPANALIFNDIDTVWPKLAATYNGEFRNLIYNDFPQEKEVLESLHKIRTRLLKIDWEIDL